uniref:Uncharacterized protein n=1 Tax=Arundo donax TaxID=35708 RepID=A0A0A9F0T5_ARUDO
MGLAVRHSFERGIVAQLSKAKKDEQGYCETHAHIRVELRSPNFTTSIRRDFNPSWSVGSKMNGRFDATAALYITVALRHLTYSSLEDKSDLEKDRRSVFFFPSALSQSSFTKSANAKRSKCQNHDLLGTAVRYKF